MGSAFVKDGFRQVIKTINRFIAILAITALGVAFFAGLKATAPDMRATAEHYLSKMNFMDYDLVSTAGFTKDDLDAVKKVNGVKEADPGYSDYALVDLSQSSLNLKLLSLDIDKLRSAPSQVIDRPSLVSGRLPEKDDEVLADPRFLSMSHKKIGDTVTLKSGTADDISKDLKYTTYIVVGTAEDTRYISYDRGNSTIGNGRVDAYLILPAGAYKFSAYTDLYLTVKNPGSLSRFDSGYDDLLKPVTKALDKLSAQREQIRYDSLKASGQKAIDDARAKLAAGQQQLAGAQQQLSDAQTQIDQGEAAYGSNLRVYQSGLAQYNQASAQLEQAKQAAGVGGMTADGIRNAVDQLEAQMAQLPATDPAYQKAAANVAGLQALLQNQRALDVQSATLQQSKASLTAARAQLDASEAQLSQSRQDYAAQQAEAQPQLDAAGKAITDGEAQLAALKMPAWYILDHNTNAGFAGFKQDADRIAALSNVFPLIFFIVAALVSLTTMTRLVENDRGYIGTMKALGYGRGMIASKYLIYAVSSSLLGSVLGLIIGFNLFPHTIFDAYSILYTLPKVQIDFNLTYALISTTAAVICAALPAYVVCLSSLHGNPAELMRPKMPPAGRRIMLERVKPLWKRLNFSQKVSIRNLFRYKKRLFMTLFGVAGCTALIFTGFGLRDAISTIVARQYGSIRQYDMEVETKNNVSGNDLKQIDGLLRRYIAGSIMVNQQSVDAIKGSSVKSVYLVVPKSSDSLRGYIDLRQRVGGSPLKLDDDSVIVTEKLAATYSLRKGDNLKLRDSSGRQYSVRVGGIAENYLFHYVYMSPGLYQKIYGGPADYNQMLCKLNKGSISSENEISQDLMKLGGVNSVNVTTHLKDNFQKMIGALKYVVLVLIFSAAALAFVVLFSLTSINIDERGRELATIKVLGFYNGELAAYIYRENIVLTLLSSILGLGLGLILERYVVVTAEVDLVMFSRQVLPVTYLYSAGLTILFAVFVNAIMYFRFRHIDMVSSLKSME